MPYSVGFQIIALTTGVQGLLQGRSTYPNTLAEYARKAVLELAEDYKFPLLQTSAPPVQLTVLQPNYPVEYFMTSSDALFSPEINKVDSFFIYSGTYSPYTSVTQTTNTGFNLKFKTINDIEVLLNVPSLPTRWTRHAGQIWIGSVPDQPYWVYMRYQKEHPFANQGTPSANQDYILFPNSWQDIVEYAVAMRIARDLNLQSKANELYTALYGDATFQKSGGIEGTPGLIFQRTSQERRDQTTTTKSMKLRMGS